MLPPCCHNTFFYRNMCFLPYSPINPNGRPLVAPTLLCGCAITMLLNYIPLNPRNPSAVGTILCGFGMPNLLSGIKPRRDGSLCPSVNTEFDKFCGQPQGLSLRNTICILHDTKRMPVRVPTPFLTLRPVGRGLAPAVFPQYIFLP